MGRVLSGILTVALLSASMPAQAQQFSDVAGTRYSDAYAYLTSRKAVSGYSDGTGRPSGTLNRVEALKVLLEMHPRLQQRAAWYRQYRSRLPLFTDVPQSAWFSPYVEAAFEAGIVTGYRDRTFRPAQPLKTEEAIVLLMRAYDLHGERAADGGDAWFRSDVDQAIEKNILAASETVYLGDPITRGTFFDMVYRLDTVKSQKLTAFGAPTSPIQRHAPLARRPAPSASPGAQGAQFSVTIPKLGIQNLAVIHPADSATSKGLLAPLKYGVGHLFAYPGNGGKVMIYGHSSGYNWDVSKYTKIFRRINELKTGDKVYVTYKGKEFAYEVTHQQTIVPTNTKPFMGRGEELILYTCWPPEKITYRLIVHAKPIGEVAVR